MVLSYKYYLHFEGEHFESIAIPLTGGPQFVWGGLRFRGSPGIESEALEGQNIPIRWCPPLPNGDILVF